MCTAVSEQANIRKAVSFVCGEEYDRCAFWFPPVVQGIR